MLNVKIQTPEVQKLSPKITVVGVGGAGGNAVNNMISSALEGCEFLVCNTDAQSLNNSLCDQRLQLGANVTGGLGAGAKPEIGEQAATESLEEVMQYLEGSNMAFITAGMGGGTGTGAAPVIAKACRDQGILTVGVVTKPFHFEGTHRMRQAEAGIEEMQDYVDTLIVIPNQNLFRIANEKTTFNEAFKMADSVLQSGVKGVTDLMVMPGLINLDFADIRSAMLEMGKAMMGTGESTGERRAIDAAEAAINNPLLDDVSMQGARGVIINVTGGHDMTLYEVDEACNRIRDEVDQNANIIFGSTFDEKLEGTMRVSVVATGIDAAEEAKTIRSTSGIKVTKMPHKEEAVAAPSNNAVEKKESGIRSDNIRMHASVAREMTLNARQTNETIARQSASAAASSVASASAGAATQPSPQTSAQAPTQAPTQAMRGSEMRGQVYQGQFIPPSPVVPTPQETGQYGTSGLTQSYAPAPVQVEQVAPVNQAAESAPIQSEITAPTSAQTPQEPIPAPTQSLVLNPPIPGARKAKAQETVTSKPPSFFERISNAYKGVQGTQNHDDSFMDDLSTQQSQRKPQQQAVSQSQQTLSEPSQGKLNIDSPAAAPQKSSEEDLDIPAFLRRQAN